jgi:GMP synthase-like glutamine amidotransferase
MPKTKMKILLINNHTDYLHNVQNALEGHEVEVQEYRPGLNFHDEDKDLVILSGGGGEGFELIDTFRGKLWHEDEMSFVLRCRKPIVGICMGFEVINASYGSKVKQLPRLIKGFKKSQLTAKGAKLLSEEELNQFEWHRFSVPNAPKEFDVLAKSKFGVEMIKHKSRPIIATQFHPEVVGGTISLNRLISDFAH